MDQVICFRTEKGQDAISSAGYCYRVDRPSADGDLFWRCLKMRCPGRLHTQSDVNFSDPMRHGRDHSYPPNAEDGMIRKAVSRMRGHFAMENISIPWIYQEGANRLSSSETASAMLPVIVSDFESGLDLIPVVRGEFPQAHHQGCYFQFTQAIWRRVQQLGLAQQYIENQLVRVTVRRLMVLGFLPVADVGLGLELIRVSLIGQEAANMGALLD
ncbi:hypothetical protein R1sor_018824 [Riccia sorocarpa]|uniref:FLYWCH-type domain-containing protein n=1 Tax=Riccia sorocarpa TaxID=122646 RepID=A0ABD3IAW0_9MARC